MTRWNSIDDVTDRYQLVFEQLQEGTIDAGAARSMTRALDGVMKTVQSRIDMARAAGRVAPGESHVPSFTFGEERPRVRGR